MDVADKIKVLYNDFQKATAELQRIEGLMNEYRDGLSTKYAAMTGDWHGLAGEAFDVCAHRILDDFALNIASLNQLALDIEQAGSYMETADQNMAQTIGRL